MSTGSLADPAFFQSISTTFSASLRSIGTAITLAATGVYLHRRGFVEGDGKRTLALLSQQLTFPLFLFTKIIQCNKDWDSDEQCPDVMSSLRKVWMLLLWPIYVVGAGLIVGNFVARWTKTPPKQVRSVLAACAFGNSTGLPITLLTVVHDNFPATSDLGRIDPSLFLSVFLLLYPVLQWGIGGWLLAPDEEETDEVAPKKLDDEDDSKDEPVKTATSVPLTPRTFKMIESIRLNNVLNNTPAMEYYHCHRKGLTSSDEGLYLSEVDLAGLYHEQMAQLEQQQQHYPETIPEESSVTEPQTPKSPTPTNQYSYPMYNSLAGLTPPLLYRPVLNTPTPSLNSPLEEQTSLLLSPRSDSWRSLQRFGGESIPNNNFQIENATTAHDAWETIKHVAQQCFQPPVIGAIAGIVVAMIPPLRGLFVDLDHTDHRRPSFQWVFDGLMSVGHSAVPINMIILGCNLSASFLKKEHSFATKTLSRETMIGIVIGKMILMPIIGIASSLFLRAYVLDIPEDIDGAFYLVLMIVFLTPTANNVMVMVELSGSGAKEGIARVIALQYAVAPIILSLTMTTAIGFASQWS